MSRLAENEGEEGKFEKEDAEINQNYTQYTKANHITQKVEEEHSDEQYRGSSSSHSSTPRGKGIEYCYHLISLLFYLVIYLFIKKMC